MPIEIHSQIYNPDVVVVVDPTLIGVVNVTEGLKEDGVLVINFRGKPADIRKMFNIGKDVKVFVVDAKRIALDILGRPIYNTPMLGATVKAVEGLVSLKSVIEATMNRFRGELGLKNVEAIKRAYEEVISE